MNSTRRTRAEHGQEIVDGTERSREVGVEEPDQHGPLVDRRDDAGPHGFGLPAG